MKTRRSTVPWFPIAAMGCMIIAQAATAVAARDISFAYEIQHAIDQGLRFLGASQNSNGWWSTPDHPAVSALALTAFMGEPTGLYRKNMPAALARGYAYIAASAKPDGSIYRTDLVNYNTSIAMMALVAARNRTYDDLLLRARGYLVRAQADFCGQGKADSPYNEGAGYHGTQPRSDIDGTLTALEALYYTRGLVAGTNSVTPSDVNWDVVVQFVQSSQHLPGFNTQAWVSADATNRGSFVFSPGDGTAGAATNSATGRVALRSCGSISYAGLLSYIYADLNREDPRVAAVLDWLRTNYTLEENPGMGPQGLYYYLHLMTKALNTSGIDMIEMKDGRKVNWRHEVAMHLINLQKPDGSWTNASDRWWESDPNLATAYALISLEIIHGGMH